MQVGVFSEGARGRETPRRNGGGANTDWVSIGGGTLKFRRVARTDDVLRAVYSTYM